MADFRHNGRLDIVSNEQEELLAGGAHESAARIMLWENLGKGQFAERIIMDKKLGGHELQVGDVDGDGDIDIASKAWGPQSWNGAGGRVRRLLENLVGERRLDRHIRPPGYRNTEPHFHVNTCSGRFAGHESSDLQISYDCFGELIASFRRVAHTTTADKLDFMLPSRTTGSELLGELGAEILRFQQSHLCKCRASAVVGTVEMVRRFGRHRSDERTTHNMV